MTIQKMNDAELREEFSISRRQADHFAKLPVVLAYDPRDDYSNSAVIPDILTYAQKFFKADKLANRVRGTPLAGAWSLYVSHGLENEGVRTVDWVIHHEAAHVLQPPVPAFSYYTRRIDSREALAGAMASASAIVGAVQNDSMTGFAYMALVAAGCVLSGVLRRDLESEADKFADRHVPGGGKQCFKTNLVQPPMLSGCLQVSHICLRRNVLQIPKITFKDLPIAFRQVAPPALKVK